MTTQEVYDVEDFSLGTKTDPDKIIFKSIEDLEAAYKNIDNGNPIYIKKDGIITKILHQAISAKVYTGSILMQAREQMNKYK